MSDYLIDVQNITKIYKSGSLDTVALKGVNFTVNKGEYLAIMGPSGSGKSTLMHILGCLDVPTSGKYLLDGKDVSKLSENDLADIRNQKIGFVFQSFNLLPRMTVLRNVMLPLLYGKYSSMSNSSRVKAAQEALDAAAFPKNFWYYFPNQLSGGMMQRVAIARALVTDPAIILADEPTGNLDTKTGDTVLYSFELLHKHQGKTIVIITHEPDVAEHTERVIHIRDGQIIDDSLITNRRVITDYL